MAKEFDEVEYTKADLATWKQVLSYMKGERRDVILLFEIGRASCRERV